MAASMHHVGNPQSGAGLGIAYVMHRSGHYKAERVIPMIFGVPSGLAALHNSGIHR